MQRCVLEIFGVDFGEGAAAEGGRIVLLLAVIGQGLAGDLASGDAAAIGEGRDEEGVDGGAALEDVEHLFHAFVDEGDSADLDADHLAIAGGGSQGAG